MFGFGRSVLGVRLFCILGRLSLSQRERRKVRDWGRLKVERRLREEDERPTPNTEHRMRGAGVPPETTLKYLVRRDIRGPSWNGRCFKEGMRVIQNTSPTVRVISSLAPERSPEGIQVSSASAGRPLFYSNSGIILGIMLAALGLLLFTFAYSRFHQ